MFESQRRPLVEPTTSGSSGLEAPDEEEHTPVGRCHPPGIPLEALANSRVEMLKPFLFVVLLAAAHCQDNNGDLESVLSQIFGKPPGGDAGAAGAAAVTQAPVIPENKNQGPVASTIVPGVAPNAGNEMALPCSSRMGGRISTRPSGGHQ
ncbi:hypothetical protein evm_013892 [Chilo suppressalis]|nr:hypothetical protein evm_013892 [Chilo suppressalis]